jgi:chaperonin cofactor prefoldin
LGESLDVADLRKTERNQQSGGSGRLLGYHEKAQKLLKEKKSVEAKISEYSELSKEFEESAY